MQSYSTAVSSDAKLDLHELLEALQAVHAGDFSIRLPGHQVGAAGKIYDTFNSIVAANQRHDIALAIDSVLRTQRAAKSRAEPLGAPM
jgi:nitrogen fixation/metabolism regulation signal transduction histidine kinase